MGKTPPGKFQGGPAGATLPGSDSGPSRPFAERVYHARNITTVTVKFELPGLPASHVFDRYFSTTVALLRTTDR